MGREGNWASGERNGRSLWSDHDVELVRQLREGGMSLKEITLKMGIPYEHVCNIVYYKRRTTVTMKAA